MIGHSPINMKRPILYSIIGICLRNKMPLFIDTNSPAVITPVDSPPPSPLPVPVESPSASMRVLADLGERWSQSHSKKVYDIAKYLLKHNMVSNVVGTIATIHTSKRLLGFLLQEGKSLLSCKPLPIVIAVILAIV